MLIGNIVRVNTESHLDGIIDLHSDNLIVILFNYAGSEYRPMRDCLKKLANQYSEYYFVLVEVDIPKKPSTAKFNADSGKFIKELRGKYLPFAFIYYDKQELCRIERVEPATLESQINDFYEKLQQKPEEQTIDSEKIKELYELEKIKEELQGNQDDQVADEEQPTLQQQDE